MGTYYTRKYRTRAGTKRDEVRLYLLGHANATVNDCGRS